MLAESWRRSARRLALGIAAAAVLGLGFEMSAPPPPVEAVSLRERAAYTVAVRAGLGSAESVTPEEGVGARGVHFEADGMQLVQDRECALGGQDPGGQEEELAARLAVAILATEQQARSPARRRLESAVAHHLDRFGMGPDWSLGPAQIRISTARPVLAGIFPQQRLSWRDLATAVEERCLALAVVRQIIRPALASGGAPPPGGWRFWYTVPAPRPVPPPAPALPPEPTRRPGAAAALLPAPAPPRPAPEPPLPSLRAFPAERAIAAYRGGEERRIFTIGYETMVADVLGLLLPLPVEADLPGPSDQSPDGRPPGISFDARSRQGQDRLESEAGTWTFSPGQTQPRAADPEDSPPQPLAWRSETGQALVLRWSRGRLEPPSVAAALREGRTAAILGALPPALRHLPVAASEERPPLPCDAALFTTAALVVPAGYRPMAPPGRAGEGC
ncbi:hypothetical protein [Roseomonas populi]|uniref:Uncharacterized protein n=1 Tax=Roseomonas populi TaxID=3121582 RepID=A0ABT1X2A5_9PROT|nr:hypothetical protein [Roseomonas pecuniae]MCR0982235.1 hypothetical protein [Roseomonas pecuniae]